MRDLKSYSPKISKEEKFITMIRTFEELYNFKLSEQELNNWHKHLYEYPEDYFLRVIEISEEIKYPPRIADIIQKFGEYDNQIVYRGDSQFKFDPELRRIGLEKIKEIQEMLSKKKRSKK